MRIGAVYFCFSVFVTVRSCRNIVTCLTDDTNDLPSGVDLVAFVGEGCRLSGDDLKIRIDTAFVTIREKLKGFTRRDHRARLLLRFLLEDAQGREIILDLLKCIQGGLAVTGDRSVTIGECRRGHLGGGRF